VRNHDAQTLFSIALAAPGKFDGGPKALSASVRNSIFALDLSLAQNGFDRSVAAAASKLHFANLAVRLR
jgi:hypothetical protein